MYAIRWATLLMLAGLAMALAAGTARPTFATEVIGTSSEPIVIELNEGHLVRIDSAAAAVFVANPEIADVAVKSPRLIYVFGKRPGETTLYAVDEQERVLLNAKLVITHNLSGLQTALDGLLPASGITAQSVGTGVVLEGAVATAREAEDARRLAAKFVADGEEVINRMRVTEANQVNLRVRIAEVSRSVVKQLGIDWAVAGSIEGFDLGFISRDFAGFLTELGTSVQGTDLFTGSTSVGGFDIDTILDALADERLITLLAEPNLTALSGETASFLAGGEFPIPVPNEDGITIEFKKFGVGLSFTPTILSANRISMRVSPEVSALSDAGAIVLSSVTIPALTVRRAETTVELGSGQTFAIAGLISSDNRHSFDEVPGLADIPILGELFKSDRFERGETELVILVTPYIVRPVSDQRLALPTDAATGPEGGQRLSSGSAVTGGATAPAGSGLVGPVGFVIQ